MTRPSKVTRRDVLDATLDLAESEGLGAVTMRAVATRLGVTPMALYRHVGDKQGLLDALVERLLDDLAIPAAELDWQTRLLQLAGGLRDIARRHPEAFSMLLQRPAATPAALARRDSVYDALREAGVPEGSIARFERILSTFLLGFAASEGGGRFAEVSTADLDADLQWAFGAVLEPLIAAVAEGG